MLSGFDEAVKILLKNKASIDHKYMDDNTLLHLAIMRGYKKVAKVLIANGIDVCNDIYLYLKQTK